MTSMLEAIRSLFALSVMAMGWWVFIWPFMISASPDNSVYNYGSIVTLLVFLGCIVVLLVIRGDARDEGNH